MLKIIKNTLKSFLSYYYKILNLQTGYNGLNIYFSFIVLILGLFTLLIREDFFNTLSNYPKILNLIWFPGIYYSLFLGDELTTYQVLAPKARAENMIQLFYYIKNEAILTPMQRTTLLRKIEFLMNRKSFGVLNVHLNQNLYEQMDRLMNAYLVEKNLYVDNGYSSVTIRTGLVFVRGFGFNILIASYNEPVWGLDFPIKRFAIFDSDSQIKGYLNKSVK